jgi:hypothetical protein
LRAPIQLGSSYLVERLTDTWRHKQTWQILTNTCEGSVHRRQFLPKAAIIEAEEALANSESSAGREGVAQLDGSKQFREPVENT